MKYLDIQVFYGCAVPPKLLILILLLILTINDPDRLISVNWLSRPFHKWLHYFSQPFALFQLVMD